LIIEKVGFSAESALYIIVFQTAQQAFFNDFFYGLPLFNATFNGCRQYRLWLV
jgi:hypothetical protein